MQLPCGMHTSSNISIVIYLCRKRNLSISLILIKKYVHNTVRLRIRDLRPMLTVFQLSRVANNNKCVAREVKYQIPPSNSYKTPYGLTFNSCYLIQSSQ